MSTIEDDVLAKFVEALDEDDAIPEGLPALVVEELTKTKGANSEKLANIFRQATGDEPS